MLRRGFFRAAEADAPGFGGGDTLGLALADVGPLVFRHKGQHLQHDVRQKGAHQVLAPAGVQQGHIQHHDVGPLFLGDDPPLLQNLPVVAPQPVDALDTEQVIFSQPPQQPIVLGPVKVLAGLLVQIGILLRHPGLPEGDPLPVLVLIPAGHPDIAVHIGFCHI